MTRKRVGTVSSQNRIQKIPSLNPIYAHKHNSILSFHHFPVNEEVKSVWTAKIRRENFSPTDSTRVCSVNFLPGDFVGPRRLNKGAVPCLFAWNNFSLPAPRLNVWQCRPRPPTPELLPADMSEEEDSLQHQLETLQLQSTFGIQRIAGSDEDIAFIQGMFIILFIILIAPSPPSPCVCVCSIAMALVLDQVFGSVNVNFCLL
uniref:THAP domain-containing protein 1 n=1 Tax=Sander lucioperca TaxID=283035 RepID=A0A8D0D7P1_SANLU